MKAALVIYSLWAVPYALFYSLSPLLGNSPSTILTMPFCLLWLFSVLQLWKGKSWAFYFGLFACFLAFVLSAPLITNVFQYCLGTYTGQPESIGSSIKGLALFALPGAVSLGLLLTYQRDILRPNLS